MPGERRLRILALLNADRTPGHETKRLCEVCAEVTQMSGAGIMLMSGDIPRGSICTTNDVSAVIERLQYDLGEGPCVDAYNQDRPVLEPDLANPSRLRWPAFAAAAGGAGARAVFGFPLRVGAARLGALNVYRDETGPLTEQQLSDSLVMADVAAEAILVLQATAEPGQIATEIEAEADFQYVVHQATGMVGAQLDVSVTTALVRLKAYAFGHSRPLADVARDVVGLRLRFDASSGEQDDTPRTTPASDS